MRPRAFIEVEDRNAKASMSNDTYERVRRTLDDALAELELAELIAVQADHSGPHAL
jgi:hypothetical protein